MFDYQSAGSAQTGTLNGILSTFGLGPISFLQAETLGLNTIFLVIVMAWMWTGFAMVILSAALKGISTELLEAARVDGATEWKVFRYIVFPLLLPTIAVVSTTIVITALKAFDIVYVMTNGNFGTQVIASQMIKESFIFGNFGHGSALAVILLLAIIPVMGVNISRFRAQEALR
jgi:alpha-glucoside transport system permease protein